ncbi:hypothetical protein AAC387_Pa05g2275 [Persea americana]
MENREENRDGSRKEQKESTFVNGFAARYVADEGDDANMGDEASPHEPRRRRRCRFVDLCSKAGKEEGVQ